MENHDNLYKIFELTGKIIQCAQYIEYNLALIISLKEILKNFDYRNSIPITEYNNIEKTARNLRDKMSENSLGYTVRIVKDSDIFNNETIESLEDILNKRNMLIHNFFKENDFEIQCCNHKFIDNNYRRLLNIFNKFTNFNNYICKISKKLENDYNQIK